MARRWHEVKTVGDGFLIVFAGAPARALRCAQRVTDAVRELGIDVRVGIHTGECERIGDDVGGMAVHVAARVQALAAPGEVLASGTTCGTVVGAGMHFEERGVHELKGVPGRWPLFSLSRQAAPSAPSAERVSWSTPRAESAAAPAARS